MALELTLVGIMTLPSYFAATVGGSKKLVSVFSEQEEDVSSGTELPAGNNDIRIEDLTFAYEEQPVLSNVNAIIPQGKVTALVGQNGSGKSTLAKLLDRLYPADGGNIYLGDTPVAPVSLRSWRSRFAVVSQKHGLFSGTLRDNICYGAEQNVGEKELSDAVKLARLEDVISAHPGGLDYEIGIHGKGLSGGEQQRVAIARALIRNASILILDEATGNLDAKTEKQIMEATTELMRGKTVIKIAHNASAIKGADHVIVLDRGFVADSGTPKEVEERNPFFQQLLARV